MSQYHLHVLLHYMHSFYLACFVLDELRMIWPFACVVTLYAFVSLGLFCVGRAPYDTWPFACVVTLYAFVSLGLFCVGRAPYDTWPFACVVTLYAFVLLGLLYVGRAPYDTGRLHVLLRYMHLFHLASLCRTSAI